MYYKCCVDLNDMCHKLKYKLQNIWIIREFSAVFVLYQFVRHLLSWHGLLVLCWSKWYVWQTQMQTPKIYEFLIQMQCSATEWCRNGERPTKKSGNVNAKQKQKNELKTAILYCMPWNWWWRLCGNEWDTIMYVCMSFFWNRSHLDCRIYWLSCGSTLYSLHYCFSIYSLLL